MHYNVKAFGRATYKHRAYKWKSLHPRLYFRYTTASRWYTLDTSGELMSTCKVQPVNAFDYKPVFAKFDLDEYKKRLGGASHYYYPREDRRITDFIPVKYDELFRCGGKELMQRAVDERLIATTKVKKHTLSELLKSLVTCDRVDVAYSDDNNTLEITGRADFRTHWEVQVINHWKIQPGQTLFVSEG